MIRPLRVHRYFPLSWASLIGFSLPITRRVPTFRERARTKLVPTVRRVPPRQYAGCPSVCLGAEPRLQFRHHLENVFDACIGSLSAHLLGPHLTTHGCLFLTAHDHALSDHSRVRWFEACACTPTPRGRPSSLSQFRTAEESELPRSRSWRRGSHVPHQSPEYGHAASMPDAMWAVHRLPPRSSRVNETPPGFDVA
jgi:hypothetical protein